MNSNYLTDKIWVDSPATPAHFAGQTTYQSNSTLSFSVQEVQPVETSDRPLPLPSADFWIALTIGATAMLTTLVVVELSTVKAVLRHTFWTKRSSKKIPCTKCRYFSDNFYLKCTVHPMDVLTERAIECRDYCAFNTEKVKKEPEKR